MFFKSSIAVRSISCVIILAAIFTYRSSSAEGLNLQYAAELPPSMMGLQSRFDYAWNALLRTVPSSPGLKPTYNAAACGRLLILGTSAQSDVQPDAVAIAKLIAESGNIHAAKLTVSMTPSFLWWLRAFRPISFTTMPVAIHETNHDIDNALTKCNNGYSTYYFKGNVWTTEIRAGVFPNASVAATYVPTRFHDRSPLSRFTKYLVESASHANDFSTLIGEFNAYVGAASFELNLTATSGYADLARAGVTAYDGNFGGMVDLMMFTLGYLKFIELHPATSDVLRSSPLVITHIQRLWTESEKIICAIAPYTNGHGGTLVMRTDKIDAIYAVDLISTLDRLQIKHMTSAQISLCR